MNLATIVCKIVDTKIVIMDKHSNDIYEGKAEDFSTNSFAYNSTYFTANILEMWYSTIYNALVIKVDV